MFSEIFIRRPKLAMVISLIVMIAGVICIFKIPVAEYPEIVPPQIMVQASYPGASSQVIADTVAAPLEAEINGVEKILYFSSQSDNNGNYQLTVTFESGSDSDIDQVNVQNAVQRAQAMLPAEVTALGITVKKQSSDILAMFAFYSPDDSLAQLFMSNYVSTRIRDAVARVPGVSNAAIFGALDYSMRIWLDPQKLAALRISTEEVKTAIQDQNIQAATGSIGTELGSDLMQYKVDADGRLKTAADFEKIIVRNGEKGRQVHLGDIARVELGAATYSGYRSFNGKPAVIMAIYRTNDANALEVVDAANAKVAELAQYFPPGMKWKLGYDPTQYVRTTMREIVVTLVMTLLLVVAITYVFLQDWRATLIPSITIPVSLIGTVLFLYLFGYSANVLTMFALILAIGSVVDDAIVVVENVMRLIEEEGLPPRQAAIKAMRQVTGPVIATTLVLLAIFAPVGFYEGMVGTIYKQFAVTMCTAIVLSTANALTLSPALCAILLRPHRLPRGPLKWFNRGLQLSSRTYLVAARFLVRRTAVTILLFGGILALNCWLFHKIPTSFLPAEDKGVLYCSVELPPGATISRTEQVIQKAVRKIQQIPEVKDISSMGGISLIGGNGENLGMIIMTLQDWSQRTAPEQNIFAVQKKIQNICAEIPAAKINVFPPPAIMGLGITGGVSFELLSTAGQTPQELAMALRGLLGKINQIPGVMYAFSTFSANSPCLYLDLDRTKTEALGVPVKNVYTALQGKLSAYYINDFNLYGYAFRVRMQADAPYRSTINDINNISVIASNGKKIPLSAIATVRYTAAPRQLKRFNQSLCAGVTVMLLPGTSSGNVMRQIDSLARETLSRDYQIEWTDMSFQERRNEGKIAVLMAFALLFGYLFLVGQYESWTVPTTVILSIAVATMGAMAGLLLFNMPLSIYAQLGLIMLVGLASKNAILMVEFSKQEREAGKTVEEAAMNGARIRYRAVLMTAYSFIIGVFPMVAATGAGAGSRRAIGTTTFCGMIAATIIGIVFIPGLYSLFQNIREKINFKVFHRQ